MASILLFSSNTLLFMFILLIFVVIFYVWYKYLFVQTENVHVPGQFGNKGTNLNFPILESFLRYFCFVTYTFEYKLILLSNKLPIDIIILCPMKLDNQFRSLLIHFTIIHWWKYIALKLSLKSFFSLVECWIRFHSTFLILILFII